MIKVYLLPVERIANTDVIKGGEFIHNAIVEGTEKPDVRKLIMDTTVDEDIALSVVALEVRLATTEEIAKLATLPPPSPPTRNLEKEIDELKISLLDFDARLKKDVGGHTR